MSFRYSGGYIGVSIGRKIRHEHDLIAEKVLGRPLPEGAVVHHVNENRSDNRNENLVICPSRAYHALLHLRMRALAESGNANYRQCVYCHQWDDPQKMSNHGKRTFKHRQCSTEYNRNRRSA